MERIECSIGRTHKSIIQTYFSISGYGYNLVNFGENRTSRISPRIIPKSGYCHSISAKSENCSGRTSLRFISQGNSMVHPNSLLVKSLP